MGIVGVSLIAYIREATLMEEHVTQGRAITLGAPHASRETPGRPFSDQRNSGTRHFTVSHEPASFESVSPCFGLRSRGFDSRADYSSKIARIANLGYRFGSGIRDQAEFGLRFKVGRECCKLLFVHKIRNVSMENWKLKKFVKNFDFSHFYCA